MLSVRAFLHLCPGVLLHSPTWLQLAKNKRIEIEVPKSGTAARFMQKRKWVEEEELRACCCLERREQ